MGNGVATQQLYPGWTSYEPDWNALAKLPDYGDKFVSLLGRYYSQTGLVPFIPDVYSVAYSQSALIRSQGYLVIDQMRLDDMIQAGTSSWVANVMTDARFEPPDCESPDDTRYAKQISDFYNDHFKDIKHGLKQCLADALEGTLGYGHTVNALPLCIVTEGKWRGYTQTQAVKYLEPHFLEPGHEKEHGELIGWAQIDRQSGTVVWFSENDVLHFAIGTLKDRARGRSGYLPAHVHWITKSLLMRLRNHNSEWNVGRIAFKRTKNETENGISQADFDAFCAEWINEYVNRWGIPVPYGVEVELLKGGVSPDVFNAVLRHADQGQLRAIGVDWMLQEEPEFGNRALGDVKQGHSNARFDLIRGAFISECQEKLVNRTAKINGWPKKLWPRFTMKPAIEMNSLEVVQTASNLQANGTISKQPQDENWYRERLGMAIVKESTQGPGNVTLSESVVFTGRSDWWKRPLSKAEERANFSAIESGLDAIMDDMAKDADHEFSKALDALSTKVEGWIKSEKISPKDIQRRIYENRIRMDMDGFESALSKGWTRIYGFGHRQARDELLKAGAKRVKEQNLSGEAIRFDAQASPADPYRLGNFIDIIKSESFVVRKGYEDRVYSAISDVLMTSYQNGYTVDETVERLRDVFKGLAAGHLIDPGKPGHDYTSQAVEETTVRTMANNAFNSARNDMFERNSDFVLGTMRSEVAEGKDYGRTGLRSHPLSAIVDGLTIRLNDPRKRRLTGALHFNDRGVDIPVTVLDEPVTWSSDEDIDHAISEGKRLSPRFF